LPFDDNGTQFIQRLACVFVNVIVIVSRSRDGSVKDLRLQLMVGERRLSKRQRCPFNMFFGRVGTLFSSARLVNDMLEWPVVKATATAPSMPIARRYGGKPTVETSTALSDADITAGRLSTDAD